MGGCFSSGLSDIYDDDQRQSNSTRRNETNHGNQQTDQTDAPSRYRSNTAPSRSGSGPYSDIELVVTVSKALEHILDTYFKMNTKNKEEGGDGGLMSKIHRLKQESQLPPATINLMIEIIKKRNILVHNYQADTLHQRRKFTSNFRTIVMSLKESIAELSTKDKEILDEICRRGGGT